MTPFTFFFFFFFFVIHVICVRTSVWEHGIRRDLCYQVFVVEISKGRFYHSMSDRRKGRVEQE